MDPLHITEFASPRYFDKLRSLNEAADNANAQPAGEAVHGSSQANTLTLPIRDLHRPLAQRRRRSDDNVRPSDQKRRTLGHAPESIRTHRRPSFAGFGFVKSKISGGHKTSALHVDHDCFVFEEEPTKHARTLHELLLGLPNELQVQIIESLPVSTILTLRRVSKSFHNIVTLNESIIARYHLSHSVPMYAQRLYPPPAILDLHYLCGLWHRLHVAHKLSVLISEHTTKEIFLRDSETKWMEFLPQHTRMRRRLMPLLFTIFHFFEKYRELHVHHLLTHGVPLCRQAFTLNPIEKQVMDLYDDNLLLAVHQVFPLVLSAFSRRLRPPSYAGRLERSIKGMLKDKPADEVYATILAVGGLREAGRFWEVKGYNSRRGDVDTWYESVLQEPVLPSSQKTKISSKFAVLTRKKSNSTTETTTMEVGKLTLNDQEHCRKWFCVRPNCPGNHGNNPILTTSLAAGPPMAALPRDELKLILCDQQPLTNIWLQTAEAVILERQVVENPTKIKRNTQVLLELIKEEGSPMDEDWAPGPLSDRPGMSRRDFMNVNSFAGAQDV